MNAVQLEQKLDAAVQELRELNVRKASLERSLTEKLEPLAAAQQRLMIRKQRPAREQVLVWSARRCASALRTSAHSATCCVATECAMSRRQGWLPAAVPSLVCLQVRDATELAMEKEVAVLRNAIATLSNEQNKAKAEIAKMMVPP